MEEVAGLYRRGESLICVSDEELEADELEQSVAVTLIYTFYAGNSLCLTLSTPLIPPQASF